MIDRIPVDYTATRLDRAGFPTNMVSPATTYQAMILVGELRFSQAIRRRRDEKIFVDLETNFERKLEKEGLRRFGVHRDQLEEVIVSSNLKFKANRESRAWNFEVDVLLIAAKYLVCKWRFRVQWLLAWNLLRTL